MFWHYVFSNNSALIEKLLEKEDVTLSELMEEEELLQECQAQNKKLVDFLSQDHVLQELVSLVVTEPSNDKAYQVRFKQASIAAELLSAEVPAIVDKLAASESLLETLCNFLSNEKPLNPLLASFFSKVLGRLLHRRSEQNWYQYQVTCYHMLDFLKNHPDFITRVAYHIGTSAIMDLLHKLMCGVEEEEVRTRIHAWVRDTPLISLLISKLGPENEWCEQASVDQLMCDVLDSRGGVGGHLGAMGHMGGSMGNGGVAAAILATENRDNSTHANSLLPLILNESIVQQLLGILLHPSSTPSSISHVTNILMKMLSIHSCVLCVAVRPSSEQEIATAAYVAAASMQHLSNEESGGGDTNKGGNGHSVPHSPGMPEFCVARTIAHVLPQIHNMLVTPSSDTVETSYGEVVERVGSTRLRLIALITALIETRHYKIHQTLAHLKTIPFIIDLLFKFPQNNFLHTLVERCVSGLLTKAAPCRTPPDAVLQETRRLARSHCLAAAAAAAKAEGEAAGANAASSVAVGSAESLPIPAAGVTSTANELPAPAGGGPDPSGSLEKMEVSGPDCDPSVSSSPCSTPALGPNIPSNNMDSSFVTSAPSAATAFSNVTDVTCESSASPLQIPSCLGDPKNMLPCDNKDDSNPRMISSEHINAHSPANVSNSGDSVAPDEDSHPLLCQLIREGRLIHRILGTYQFGSQGEAVPPPGSLCGYRGHVRNIANAVVDHSSSGDNAPLLNALLQVPWLPSLSGALASFLVRCLGFLPCQSLPTEVQDNWSEFQRTVLAETNAANAVTPLPGHPMLFDFDDSEDDDVRVFRGSLPPVLQTDNMLQISEGDMHLSFDENGFEAPNASTNAASTCPSTSSAGHTSPTADFEGLNSDAGSADLFEKICRRNLYSGAASDDQFWDDKEQAISFAPNAHKVNEAEVHSSDEEDEADKDERIGGRLDTSMEVDELQDDWESVFDRRNSDPPAGGAPRSSITVPVPMPAPVPSPSSSCSPSSATTPPADFNPWVKPPSANDVKINAWIPGSEVGPGQTSAPGWANFGNVDSFTSTNPIEPIGFSSEVSTTAAVAGDDFAPFKAKFPGLESAELPTATAASVASAGGGSEAVAPADSSGAVTSSDVPQRCEGASRSDDQELQSNFHFLSGLGALKSHPPKSEDTETHEHSSLAAATDASSPNVVKDGVQETKPVSITDQSNFGDFNVENKQVDCSEGMEIDSEFETVSNSDKQIAAKVDMVKSAAGSEKDD
ncbi:SIT4 phosphatase-associated protein family [Trinorchestia longiramus]|nr:SIT4 phosphatase-associated protein family [Trinorchestia longiramus]